ncbi:MAG TPA: NUDIX domain-containing protein [Candidatus Saccharimonadales bacterium]|nr:NUDIX domain-containing protein [Candidatus Saccharimonadales bacterium]
MRQRFTVVPAAYVIMRRGKEVLLIRRAYTGYFDGYYSFPSGHIDGGESAKTAAIREAKEEVGVVIKPEDLRFVHVMHRIAEEGDHERVDFAFETTEWQGEPTNVEPDKCDDVQWFPLDALPDTIVPLAREMLEHVAAGSYYSDHRFETPAA